MRPVLDLEGNELRVGVVIHLTVVKWCYERRDGSFESVGLDTHVVSPVGNHAPNFGTRWVP